MPEELLLNMVKALQATIEEGFPFRSDQTDLLVRTDFGTLPWFFL